MNDTVLEGKLQSFSFQTQEQSSHAKMARRDHKDEILHGTEKETGSEKLRNLSAFTKCGGSRYAVGI